jgi:hypothetical protein
LLVKKPEFEMEFIDAPDDSIKRVCHKVVGSYSGGLRKGVRDWEVYEYRNDLDEEAEKGECGTGII